jgi:cell division protein FtsQ
MTVRGRTTDRPASRPETADERTVRLARKRFARRQWARRWLAWRSVALALLVLGVAGLGVWLVFFSSVLAVQGVRVDGTGVLDPRAVRRAADVPVGTPLATVDLDAIAKRVERLDAVRSVDVSRSWPDKVRVLVRERVAVAVVERAGRLRGLDETGMLFRTYLSRPADLPVIRKSPSTDADALAEAARVAGALPADLAARVAYVQVRTVDTISLRLRNGRTVLWGSADESVEKAKVLAVLLEQKASLYDVSVPGQPVLRK